MNKRARNRLIGVTAILFALIGAILVGTTAGGPGAGAYFSTVDEVLADDSFLGQNVKVSGIVVEGSWDRGTRPMEFEIRGEGEEIGAATIRVVYDGTVPTTFGDGTNAIVTGEYTADGLVSTEMIVKCPSKYESSRDAITVTDAVEMADEIEFARIEGDVTDIGGDGLTIEDDENELEVRLETALPENVVIGTHVVVDGAFDDEGEFAASDVAEVAE